MESVESTVETVIETKDTVSETDIYQPFFDAGFNGQEYPKTFGSNHAKAKVAYANGQHHRRSVV